MILSQVRIRRPTSPPPHSRNILKNPLGRTTYFWAKYDTVVLFEGANAEGVILLFNLKGPMGQSKAQIPGPFRAQFPGLVPPGVQKCWFAQHQNEFAQQKRVQGSHGASLVNFLVPGSGVRARRSRNGFYRGFFLRATYYRRRLQIWPSLAS